MKQLLSRITLECYRQPGDTDKAPWYAYPLTVLFVTGWLAADHLLTAVL
ncbi:hypothetical protein [Pusillimonas noertemannii]|uniref:Uncharacterized protein n=1 Tax=Pusillimonas noertemannii TaxID=305977 RepID=A0A2U1CRS6_9BURK|nr:hypothetical protein [Pusillimonas noertemannii]NYT67936.1 hypothetical protein [Pusillimonas noertemannii]PVY68607.1 hypothetical protein C7440_1018 [Pusillimonas noertemannii]